jgi:hypothetical protein
METVVAQSVPTLVAILEATAEIVAAQFTPRLVATIEVTVVTMVAIVATFVQTPAATMAMDTLHLPPAVLLPTILAPKWVAA